MRYAIVLLVALAAAGPPNHATEGLLKARAGDYVGAMESFRLARSDHMGKEAYMAWGMAAMNMGKFRSAAAKFGMASGRDPKDGDPLALMGECYLRAGAPREAIASFARIRSLPLSNPVGVKIAWGTADNMAGAYEQALALFREAKSAAPPERRGEIVRGEATSLLSLGRLDAAETLLSEYLRSAPDDGAALALAGAGSLKRGDYATAAERLKGALSKGAPVGPTAYDLACAESRRQRYEAACEALKRSCAVGFDCRTPMATDPDLASLRELGCPE